MERAPPRRLLPVLVRAAAANAISGMRASVLRGRAPMRPRCGPTIGGALVLLLYPAAAVSLCPRGRAFTAVQYHSNKYEPRITVQL